MTAAQASTGLTCRTHSAAPPLRLSPDIEALAAQAEQRVRTLTISPAMTAVSRFLLRSEAIASSRIEGIAPSAHKVALAELGQYEEVKGSALRHAPSPTM